jgi:pimeloyl-ACP methyl ester carboxylesterase
VDGLHYELRGHGPVVVLIHGAVLDARMWDPQLPALASAHRVLRYDLRSHGRSASQTRRTRAYDDLRLLMDSLRIPRATVVGLSAGAAVATDFALAHPERVERLVLAAPSVNGFVPRERPAWLADLARVLRAGHTDSASALFAASPLMQVPDSARAAWLRGIVMDNARLWRDTIGPATPLAPAAYGRLAQLEMPVRVIVGEEDAADVRMLAGAIASNAPDAEVVWIPGAGHLVNVAQPARFDAALLEFLRRPVMRAR